MLAVIRHYEHLAPAAAQAITDARAQVEALLRAVPGTDEALLIRTRHGLALIAVGTDEWCLSECGRRFRAWAEANIAGFAGTEDAGLWIGEVIGSSRGPSPSPGGE